MSVDFDLPYNHFCLCSDENYKDSFNLYNINHVAKIESLDIICVIYKLKTEINTYYVSFFDSKISSCFKNIYESLPYIMSHEMTFINNMEYNKEYSKLAQHFIKHITSYYILIKTINTGCKIYVSGFGKSGAISQLFAYHMSNLYANVKLIVNTFSSPNVGNYKFRNEFSKKKNIDLNNFVLISSDNLYIDPCVFVNRGDSYVQNYKTKGLSMMGIHDNMSIPCNKISTTNNFFCNKDDMIKEIYLKTLEKICIGCDNGSDLISDNFCV